MRLTLAANVGYCGAMFGHVGAQTFWRLKSARFLPHVDVLFNTTVAQQLSRPRVIPAIILYFNGSRSLVNILKWPTYSPRGFYPDARAPQKAVLEILQRGCAKIMNSTVGSMDGYYVKCALLSHVVCR